MGRLPKRLQHGEGATVVEHLEELRWRIIIVLGALALTTIVAFAFHGHVLDWLNHPLPADRRRVVTLGVAEPFTVSVRVSVYAGFLLALPVILWQFWSFFAPAFDPSIERNVLGLVAFASALGTAGLAFGYWIVLPRALEWLTHYDDTHFTNLIQAKAYYSFTSTVLLGIVLVFELPVIVLGLVSIGVLSSATLRANRRLGYFIVAVVALGLPGPGSRDHGARAPADVGPLRGLDLARLLRRASSAELAGRRSRRLREIPERLNPSVHGQKVAAG